MQKLMVGVALVSTCVITLTACSSQVAPVPRTVTQTVTATATPSSQPPAAPRSACDPNYSGGCVPSVSYDLDCGDIRMMVRVVGADVHGFDRDQDGLGCESYG